MCTDWRIHTHHNAPPGNDCSERVLRLPAPNLSCWRYIADGHVGGTRMNRLAAVAVFAFAAAFAHAQPAASPPTGPAPTGLVVGSGNFYSPIVANLEDAIAFYRAVGFEFQGEPANADANLPLRQMFGLPDAKLRYQIGRAPGLPGGVEIIEISGAGGQRLNLKVQDPGTVLLQVVVRDIDAAFTRLKAIKAPVASTGGNVMSLPDNGIRAVLVQDPAGHFIRL